MEFKQIELRRETIFKDAMMNAAEAKSMDIIADAQREAAAQLAQAKTLCKEADHDVIATQLARGTDRDHSAAVQSTRRELLAHRQQMVEELFGEVEKRLAAFVAGGQYEAWVLEKLKIHVELAKNGEVVTVYLRKEDMPLEKAIQKVLPGARLQQDDGIRLGGVKVSCGNRLFDETMDSKIEEEKETFYRESGMLL